MGSDDHPQGEAHAPDIAQPGLRFLELAVYIMGGLLVLMLVVLLGGIAYKVATRGDTPPPAPKSLALDGIAAVNQMELDGDRLALNTGSEIIVIDIRKGTVLTRIKLN